MFTRVHVMRVKPGQRLAADIGAYCRQRGIGSAVIIGIIGSVQSATLNFLKGLPGEYESHEYPGPLEIVAAQGSVALKGADTVVHIHIQLSGEDFSRGGHLVEAIVFSTAEVVIGELDFQLRRYADAYTGLNELES